jgi:hypothetical protein
MGLSQKTVTVCTEIDTLLSVLTTAIADVKSGKNAAQIFADIEPKFVGALTGIGELKAEVADRKDLERTIALKGCDLIDAVVG